ncbi:MAG: cobalamin-dependent protein, partial [Candidatus Omnitrophota bacterium]
WTNLLIAGFAYVTVALIVRWIDTKSRFKGRVPDWLRLPLPRFAPFALMVAAGNSSARLFDAQGSAIGGSVRADASNEGSHEEFRYYVRDDNGELFKERSGFPGQWVVSVDEDVSLDDAETAAVQRMVKSFSRSAEAAGRGDCMRAKFVVSNRLPGKQSGIVYRGDGFIIRRSGLSGLEVIAERRFIFYGISEQRRLFSAALKDQKVKPARVKRAGKPAVTESRKAIRAVVFNGPGENFGDHEDNARRLLSPYYSSLVVASYLKKRGLDVEIRDMEADGRGGIESLRRILASVDMVCLSAVDSTIPMIHDFIGLLREAKPDIIVAVGGPTVTVLPEHAAAFLREANIFYRGEIEAGFGRILPALEMLKNGRFGKMAPGQFPGCGGAAYHFGNTYYFNDLEEVNRMTEDELNAREIDFSLLGPEQLKLTTSFMSSIGCLFNCDFCSISGGRWFRGLAPGRVVAMIRAYQRRLEDLESQGRYVALEAWRITFNDDNFFYDKKRALRILSMLKDAGLRITIDGIQGGLMSFLFRKNKGAPLEVDKKFIEELSKFSNVFTKGQILLYIGTDAIVDSGIRGLNKPPYTERLIGEVMAEFDRNRIHSLHYLIFTHPKTRLKALLRTFIRMWYLEAVNEYATLTKACNNANFGVGPHTGTRVMNRLVEEENTGLLRGGLSRVRGFSEYDLYTGQAHINSPYIPDSVREPLKDMFLNKRFASVSLANYSFAGITYLALAMEAINSGLDSVNTAQEWEIYRGLLDDDLARDFRMFWKKNQTIKSMGLDTSMGRLWPNYKAVVRKLGRLRKRFESDRGGGKPAAAPSPATPGLDPGADGEEGARPVAYALAGAVIVGAPAAMSGKSGASSGNPPALNDVVLRMIEAQKGFVSRKGAPAPEKVKGAGGIAADIAAVIAGVKPAAVAPCTKKDKLINALVREARRRGLTVRRAKIMAYGWKFHYIVTRDPDDAQRIITLSRQLMSGKIRHGKYDIELGNLLGYSQAAIAAFVGKLYGTDYGSMAASATPAVSEPAESGLSKETGAGLAEAADCILELAKENMVLLGNGLSALRGCFRRANTGSIFRLCVPMEVLKNSPDIIACINKLDLQEGVSFELVATGVKDEDFKAVEALKNPQLRDSLNIPGRFSVSRITEADILERIRISGDTADAGGRARTVRNLAREQAGTSKPGDAEYTAIVTEPVCEEEASGLQESLTSDLGNNTSILIALDKRPFEAGHPIAMYSLTEIVKKWFGIINDPTGSGSGILTVLPAMVSPDDMAEKLRDAMTTLWLRLSRAA